MITEAKIDKSLERLFVARIKLGMFDPPERVPFSKIPYSEIDSAEHRKLALEAARKSIVLLKNENQTLPVKGFGEEDSGDRTVGGRCGCGCCGNYNGFSSKEVAPLEGIRSSSPERPRFITRWALRTPRSRWRWFRQARSSGITAEYFDNADLEGQPKLRRAEPRPYYQAGPVDAAVNAAGFRRADFRCAGRER